MIGYLLRRRAERKIEDRLAHCLCRVVVAEKSARATREDLHELVARLEAVEARVAQLEAVAHEDGLADDVAKVLELPLQKGDASGA